MRIFSGRRTLNLFKIKCQKTKPCYTEPRFCLIEKACKKYFSFIHDYVNCCNIAGVDTQGVNWNIGKMTLLRNLGKSVRVRAYPQTVRHAKHVWGSVGFLFRGFYLEKISMTAIYGIFSTC